ncbi:MAG: flagellar basal body-associated FliL family protein [Pseudobdellovibrionaceae bacterium]|jgi:flagellar FliL protein|nr:flagellar basal body-associated FliL family protein [Pseudobdellovibrionaceae bacterium]
MSEDTADKDQKSAEVGENGDVQPIDDGGGKMKKIIMIVIPLLLLIGGGAGLYFTGTLDKLLGKEDASQEKAEGGDHGEEAGSHEEKAAESKGEGHGGAEGEHAAGSVFMKIPDLIVNLTSSGQPRYLRLSIQLELNSEEDMKKVEMVMPRVVDQFQTYLRELRVEDLRGSKGIYRLQMELLARVNAAAAPVEVKDVLFQEILIQ